MNPLKLKIVLTSPEFFSTPLKKIEIETPPNVGRVYFLKAGRIVAVGQRIEEVAP